MPSHIIIPYRTISFYSRSFMLELVLLVATLFRLLCSHLANFLYAFVRTVALGGRPRPRNKRHIIIIVIVIVAKLVNQLDRISSDYTQIRKISMDRNIKQ